MAVQVYFLRHGETSYSRTGGFCGFTDAELTPEGELMAEDFASKYAALPWEGIYCSPLQRTVATATPLAGRIGLKLALRDGLKEINYGQWEKRSHAEVKEQYQEDYSKWLAEPAWNAPTGGETAFQIAERSTAVIQEILSRHASGNVLVVSHKATIRIILCTLLGMELGRYRDRINVLTASVSMLKFDSHGPMLEILGDRSHLRAELRGRPGT